MRFPRSVGFGAALGVLLAVVSTTARADGPSDLEAALAEPVVSTASKAAEDLSTAPATVTTITAEDIRRYGIKTLDEAINFLGLGLITQNALIDPDIGGRGVLLAGDYGDHVLLLINGHAVNEQWGGTAYFGRGAGVPMELIDHIELVLGAGSVLYGSQAMLGVVNIVTKQAKDFDGVHFIGEGDLFTNGRGAIGFGKEFTLLGKRAELTYELEYYGQSGPAFTFGPQSGQLDDNGKGMCFSAACKNPGIWGGTPTNQASWQKIPSAYVRFLWDNFEFDFHAMSYQRAKPYQNYTGYNDPDQYQIDRFLSADLRYRWKISTIAQLQSRLYGDLYDYREQLPGYSAYDCSPAPLGNGCIYTTVGNARWFGLEEQLSFDWLHDKSLTTLLGVDGRIAQVGASNYDTNLSLAETVAPYGNLDRLVYKVAVYGEQTWRPIQWLSFNVGARFDEEEREADPVDKILSTNYDRLSPRGSLAINPWRSGTLKFIYSEAFRAPSNYETSFTDFSTAIPNANLQPEVVRSGEVSFEQRVGAQRFFVGGFLAEYSNMVLQETVEGSSGLQAVQMAIKNGVLPAVSNPKATYVNSILQYQNVSNIDNHGINASFDGSALNRDLRYGANLTWAYAKQTQPNPNGSGLCPTGLEGSGGTPTNATNCTGPFTVTPYAFGNARISYDLPGLWPIVGVAASIVGPRPANYAFAGWATVPYAPTQVDLRGTVSGAFPGIPHLSYRFIVDYAFSGVNPYVVGPNNSPTTANPAPELVPVDQLRTTIGLQYDLR
jgi:outer membrane receptor for ferrienterochelin and colicins